MTPKFVLLWTDAVLWLLVIALAWYGWHVRRNANLRDTWSKVFADAPSLCSALVIALFLVVTLLDSVHYRRALPPSATATAGSVAYDTRTTSLLDGVLAGLVQSREASYSVPLATVGFTKETRDVGGQPARIFPRLVHGGAHLKDPSEWRGDVLMRVGLGIVGGLVVAALVTLLTARAHGRGQRITTREALGHIARNRTQLPLRAALLTVAVIAVLAGIAG